MSIVSDPVEINATTPHTVPFPKHGVRFPVFLAFIESCGGRDALANQTTEDVCHKYVKPMTLSIASSYCDFLIGEVCPHVVPKADVFISHAWRYNFLDVVDALEHHFKDQPDIGIWFDLFSNNQHRADGLPFEWWQTIFRSAIEDFKHTVLILAPWNNPIAFTRAWCLFEIFTSVDTGSKFEVALPVNKPSS